MKFKIGDKIVEKSSVQAHTSYVLCEVVGFLDGALLAKFYGWGDGNKLNEYKDNDERPGTRSWRTALLRYSEDEVFTPEEVVEELKRLESAKSKLEVEFEGVRELVRKNMEDAAKLVRGASALVKPTGKDFYDLVEEGKDLYKALDEGGWSHSTMRCRYGSK